MAFILNCARLSRVEVSRRNILLAGSFLAVLVLSIGIQFRVQLHNGFTVLYGDSYDAAIVVTILEHWFNVLKGLSHWSELYYFYPYTKTLGQTDGYFLIGMIYPFFRLFNVDPFLSAELSNVVVRIIGFASFYLLARRMFKLHHGWALLGAALFIIANNLTAHGQRLQLSTVSFAPIMGLSMWYMVCAIKQRHGGKVLGWGAASGVFLGAWSITCFYITWFFIYFATFYLAILYYLLSRADRSALINDAKAVWKALVGVGAITAASLFPLLHVYLSKSKEVGMRSYESALAHTVPLEGIAQTGKQNYLFGGFYERLLAVVSPGYTGGGEYYNTGIAPILLFLFAVALVCVIWSKAGKDAVMWRAMAFATVVTWLGVINIGGHSLWYFLYTLFPGAKALNVVGAYQIFLSIPVLMLALKYLSSVQHRLPAGIICLLVGLLVAEELNSGYITLERNKELAKVALHNSPPQGCKSFYVSGWASQDPAAPLSDSTSNFYAHNVSAMLIAEMIRLPTLNGIASFSPKDWDFAYPNWPDYDQRMKRYADNHKLTDVCRLELNTLEWSRAW